MTTMPARPPAWEPLETALRARRPIRLSYHGRQRLVCPHALGWNNHRPMLLVYQASGQTSAASLDPRNRWRCMYIEEIENIVAAHDTTPWATADNYNPTHPFNTIDHVIVAVSPTARPHHS